jgi:hypothetical protein
VLREIDLQAWSEQEAADFFSDSFARADMTLGPQALTTLVDAAGGIPMLAHEIGDAVYHASSGDVVTLDDVTMGHD